MAREMSADDKEADLLREEAATIEAIREGLASIDRGEGIPANDAIDSLRVKYRIPADA
jgi:predicted transcriptional regulator